MLMKIIKAVAAAAHLMQKVVKLINAVVVAANWIERVLEVRLPMDVVAGLRTR
jgi:hypothetical protein